MTRFAQVFSIVSIASLALAGCGGGGSGGSGSGVTGTKTLSSLTDTEKGSVCDWFVGQVGGYGAVGSCNQAVLNAPKDKAECTTGFPTCAITVTDFESCAKALIAAQTTCTEQAITDAFAKPECSSAVAMTCFAQK